MPDDGFVARCRGTVRAEFCMPGVRATFSDRVEALPADLGARLVHDNRERPHLGNRHQGRRPWETIELCCASVTEVDRTADRPLRRSPAGRGASSVLSNFPIAR